METPAENLLRWRAAESRHRTVPGLRRGLVLADEPTGNLDRENGQKIAEILKILAHTQNRCAIVVTHDPELAAQADVQMTLRDSVPY